MSSYTTFYTCTNTSLNSQRKNDWVEHDIVHEDNMQIMTYVFFLLLRSWLFPLQLFLLFFLSYCYYITVITIITMIVIIMNYHCFTAATANRWCMSYLVCISWWIIATSRALAATCSWASHIGHLPNWRGNCSKQELSRSRALEKVTALKLFVCSFMFVLYHKNMFVCWPLELSG